MGLIHNNKRLDDAQKLYYLKGYLTGDAEYLLRNVNVTSENYRASWEKLESIYNNKRFLANGTLKRLFSQKALTGESATDIKRLVSTTSDCLESIKNLGIDVASWDILIIHIVSAKLDKETRRDWELKVASDPTDNLSTFNQFSEFLISRYRGLENMDTKPDRAPKSTQRKMKIVVSFPKRIIYVLFVYMVTTLLSTVETLSGARCVNAATIHCYTRRVW